MFKNTIIFNGYGWSIQLCSLLVTKHSLEANDVRTLCVSKSNVSKPEQTVWAYEHSYIVYVNLKTTVCLTLLDWIPGWFPNETENWWWFGWSESLKVLSRNRNDINTDFSSFCSIHYSWKMEIVLLNFSKGTHVEKKLKTIRQEICIKIL